MKEQEKVTMYVDFSHLSQFPHQDPQFMQTIVHYFYKFEPNLRAGLTKFMQHGEMNIQGVKKSYYQVAIYNLPQMSKIRDLRTLSLGRLMSVYGTVTRTTDAKPELILGNFQCMECNQYV
jgi:DNA replication licensing factor MCM6